MTATVCSSKKLLDCELKTSDKKTYSVQSFHKINGYFMIYPIGREFAISLFANGKFAKFKFVLLLQFEKYLDDS